MTVAQWLAEYRDRAGRLLVCSDCAPITPSATPYSFGVARALQAGSVGGNITVITLDGSTVTVPLVAGGRLDCPTTACTVWTGTGLIAYI